MKLSLIEIVKGISLGGAVLFVTPTAFGQAANTNAAIITVKPQIPLIERSVSQQFLNFDFQLENLTDTRLKIDSIQLSVFDSRGKFVLRRTIDSHGIDPALFTIRNIEIEPKGGLNVFNPFYSFDSALDLATLRFEFDLLSDPGDKPYVTKFEVRPKAYQPKTNLTVPLDGLVIVEFGHDFYSPHRRIDLTNSIVRQVGLKANSARYANDLSIVDKNGALFRGDKNRLENWFAYGAALFSPGAGRIVTLVDGIPDNKMENGRVVFAKEITYENPSNLLGNFIVIDHGNGEFSLFAHLKQGSFKLKKGEVVRQGQQLAQIGFSGDADFVHTHYQLQSNADPGTAEGLPAYFRNYRRILGGKILPVANGAIDSGSIVTRR